MFLPQFLGVLVYFRLKRYPELGHLVGFLLTTIFSSFILVLLSKPSVQIESHQCGVASFAIVIFILFFTCIQMFFSLIAQVLLYKRYRAPGVKSMAQ
jgi:hypothetical protein